MTKFTTNAAIFCHLIIDLIWFEHVLLHDLSAKGIGTCSEKLRTPPEQNNIYSIKIALGVCFALKSSRELLLLFTYLISLCKDITFPVITKFKSNRPQSYISVNRIPN